MALLGAGMLVALVILQSNANRQRDRALQLQSHSYDVMILARTLSGTIARARRRWAATSSAATRRSGALIPTNGSRPASQIDRLDALTADNADQQQRDRPAARAPIDARGNELSVTALSTAYKKNSQAYSRYYEAGKSSSLREIDGELDAIISAERTLARPAHQRRRWRSVERSTEIARILAIFGVLIVLGAIVLGWLTIGAMQRARGGARRRRHRTRAVARCWRTR